MQINRVKVSKEDTIMQTIDTPFGVVEADPAALELGEILVTEDGVEIEVVGLNPLRFEEAPQEDEDWGE
jgi:lysine biosynthesis protein LysW